jgi:hypothetical protein
MLGLRFTKIATYPNIYYLFDRYDMLVLFLYVSGLILTSSTTKLIIWCKTMLACEFDMKDINLMHYLLGLEVWQSPSEVFLE